MAKIARVSLQLARKSVPVADLLQSAQLPQTTPRETMIRRGYTLCEVLKDGAVGLDSAEFVRDFD